MRLSLVLLLAFCWGGASLAQWRSPDGAPIPDTEARKTVDGFGASLLVTPDPDWEAKWNTPSDVTPQFREAKTVKMGGKLTVLIFYANPKPDAANRISVRCDIRLKRPNGTLSVDLKDAACAEGPLRGDPRNVRLAAPVIGFIGEPGDPLGEWRVEVSLTDAIRGTTVPVRTSFKLE